MDTSHLTRTAEALGVEVHPDWTPNEIESALNARVVKLSGLLNPPGQTVRLRIRGWLGTHPDDSRQWAPYARWVDRQTASGTADRYVAAVAAWGWLRGRWPGSAAQFELYHPEPARMSTAADLATLRSEHAALKAAVRSLLAGRGRTGDAGQPTPANVAALAWAGTYGDRDGTMRDRLLVWCGPSEARWGAYAQWIDNDNTPRTADAYASAMECWCYLAARTDAPADMAGAGFRRPAWG